MDAVWPRPLDRLTTRNSRFLLWPSFRAVAHVQTKIVRVTKLREGNPWAFERGVAIAARLIRRATAEFDKQPVFDLKNLYRRPSNTGDDGVGSATATSISPY